MAFKKLFQSFIRSVPPIVNKFDVLNSVQKSNFTPIAHLRTSLVLASDQLKTQKEFVPEEVVKDNELSESIINKVNEGIQQKSHGRLFAVVQIMGKQFKVTDEDLIILEGHWPPTVGDKLKLEKVLLIGGADFTLIGTPVLSRDIVSVTATIIEKKMSNTKTRFRYFPRKQYKRTRFVRKEQTMLRINKVEAIGLLDNDEDIIGASRAH